MATAPTKVVPPSRKRLCLVGYDEAQLNVLKPVFDEICIELGIEQVDAECRERIALALVALGNCAQLAPEKLKAYGIAQFEGCMKLGKRQPTTIGAPHCIRTVIRKIPFIAPMLPTLAKAPPASPE